MKFNLQREFPLQLPVLLITIKQVFIFFYFILFTYPDSPLVYSNRRFPFFTPFFNYNTNLNYYCSYWLFLNGKNLFQFEHVKLIITHRLEILTLDQQRNKIKILLLYAINSLLLVMKISSAFALFTTHVILVSKI